MIRSGLAGVLAAISIAVAARGQADFAERYKATLDRSDPPAPLPWLCSSDDAWRLSSFEFKSGDDLKITSGPATVVFGHHEKNVVWAALFPETAGTISAKGAGNGDAVQSIWLRLHPAELSNMFPAGRLAGPGSGRSVLLAKRMAAWKMRGSMQANDLPVIPKREWTIFDLDTTDGVRRFYFIDSKEKTVKYENAFEKRPLPKLEPVDTESATSAFDQVWGDFDREYAMFGLRPDVDWSKLRDALRPQAAQAKSTYELAAVLAQLLAPLKDLHISVRVGEEYVPVFDRPRVLNASFPALSKMIQGMKERGKDMAGGRTDDGIGYLNVFRLSDSSLPNDFDAALATFADTWALVVDLRFNGGGSETLAQQIAARFTDERRVYSINQYRSGPAHDNLGEKLERSIDSRGLWTYRSPVIVLIGQKTMSSAESFALMLAQCPQVTTMGDNTAGSSGNPRQIKLPGSISVNLPRWIDMDPGGKPIDTVGIEPKVKLTIASTDFTGNVDPVLDAALKRLRETPAEARKPGRRE